MRTRAMVLAACLAVAGLLTSCDGGSSPTTGSPQTEVSQPAGATTSSPVPATSGGSDSSAGGSATTVPRAGAMLFASYCAGCHGNDGKAKLAPTVVGVAAATVKAATEKGTGSMPGFTDRLSPADIDAVVAFVGTLK
ncbi:MAG: cytochrome c [Thermoleophilia bacterium]|jgi:mono/diheme cytochrome c family protein|nr:cytochrome c [Thermoleophilia bacterium]